MGCNPAPLNEGRARGREDWGSENSDCVRAVSLLRNRHDADVSRYIPGSTTTALLSSNPDVPGPARGGCTGWHGGEENALATAGGGGEGENGGGENRGCRVSGAVATATATVVGQRREEVR